jgi:hypothetical protein
MKNGRGRKTTVYLLVCLCAGLILLLAAILIVPRFIDRDAVVDKVRREVSKLVEDEFDFELHDVEADLQNVSGKVTFLITGASDILSSVSISGWTNIRQFKSYARILLKNLRPGTAFNALWPDAALKVQGANTYVSVGFTMDTAEKMKMNFDLTLDLSCL